MDATVKVALIGLASAIIVALLGAPYVAHYFENKPPVVSDMVTDKASPQLAFSIITFNAKASDPEGDKIYYNFWLKGPSTNGRATEMTGWTTSNKWNWSTSDTDVGNNEIEVRVRDLEHQNTSHSLNKEYLIKYPRDVRDRNTKCSDLITRGLYKEALSCLSNSIAINPNDANAWNAKGWSHFSLGEYVYALNCFNRSIEIEPLYKQAWLNKGRLLGVMGLYNDSLKSIDRAIEIDPYFARAWSDRGVTFSRQGNQSEAFKCYQKAVEMDPRDPIAWNNLGSGFLNYRNYTEAIKCFDKAIELYPTYTTALEYRGKTLKALGYDADAEVAFAKARASGYDIPP
jgi:tetratricopeptide (TPR) repeat protein